MNIRVRNIDSVRPHNGSYGVRCYFRAVVVAVERVDLRAGLNNWVHYQIEGYSLTRRAVYGVQADLLRVLTEAHLVA